MFTPIEKEGTIYYFGISLENYNFRKRVDTEVVVFVVSAGSNTLVGYRHEFNREFKQSAGECTQEYVHMIQQSMVKTLNKEINKECLLRVVSVDVENLYHKQSENLRDWLPTLEVITDHEGNREVKVKI